MDTKKQLLIKSINEAFRNVRLEDGIGLLEANAMDNYISSEEIKDIKKKDERMDWNNIPTHLLNECHYSLSYFDAKGMRFHLPVFMLASLKNNKYRFDLVSKLIHLTPYTISQFESLSKNQKNAVFLFLEYMKDENYQLDKEDIEKSLKEYWLK